MSKVFTGASMSLDGYIAGPNESGFEHLFQWYGNGDVEVTTTHPELTMHMRDVSAQHFRQLRDMTGALVVGRKLFDQLTDVPVALEGPVSVVEGTGVTHLRYRVRQ